MKILLSLSYFEQGSYKLKESKNPKHRWLFLAIQHLLTIFPISSNSPGASCFQFLVLVLQVGLHLQLQGWPTRASNSLEPQWLFQEWEYAPIRASEAEWEFYKIFFPLDLNIGETKYWVDRDYHDGPNCEASKPESRVEKWRERESTNISFAMLRP